MVCSLNIHVSFASFMHAAKHAWCPALLLCFSSSACKNEKWCIAPRLLNREQALNTYLENWYCIFVLILTEMMVCKIICMFLTRLRSPIVLATIYFTANVLTSIRVTMLVIYFSTSVYVMLCMASVVYFDCAFCSLVQIFAGHYLFLWKLRNRRDF